MSRRWRLLAVFSLILSVASLAQVQSAAPDRLGAADRMVPEKPLWVNPPASPAPSPPFARPLPITPGGPVFQKLARAAGIVFSGRVTFVGHSAASAGANPASTVITFQVECGIRGVSAGQSLTIHEWAGLWAGGERYRVGERLLLFLYPPSKLGFTSPVAGALGRFAIDAGGHITLSAFQSTALAGDSLFAERTDVAVAELERAVRRYIPEKGKQP